MAYGFLGDKNEFAIEFEVSDSKSLFGKILLYLGGKTIGFYEDLVPLGVTAHALKRVLYSSKICIKELYCYSLNEVFDRLVHDPTGRYDTTIISLGESFDDFVVRCIKKGDDLVFMWKLVATPFFNYENYEKEVVHSCLVPIDLALQVCEAFQERLERESGILSQE